jgi:uncharacterized YigZ family protein
MERRYEFHVSDSRDESIAGGVDRDEKKIDGNVGQNQSLREGQYLTVESPVDYALTIKRSHFIASLRFAERRIDFDEELKMVMLKFPKATHYCWAYRFASPDITEHSSDAGEPAGTAGRPILGALKKYSLLNVMAVVTRFYGGIKLGVAGLTDAYANTTTLALKEARVVVREPMTKINFFCSYDLYNTMLSICRKHQCKESPKPAVFQESISGEIYIPTSLIKSALKDLEELSQKNSKFSCTIS